MAAAIRFKKQKLFLLLSTLYQQWLQKATGARMYCALFEQGPGEKFRESWKDRQSGVRGLDPTLGECMTDRETASACLQAVTLFAPTVYSSHSSLESDLDPPKQRFLSTTVCLVHSTTDSRSICRQRLLLDLKSSALFKVVQTGDTKQGNK